MWKNYFKLSLRRLYKNKGFALLHIFGLTLGVTACMLISAYVWHEFQYDRFHEKGERIYRLNTDLQFSDQTLKLALAAGPAAPALQEEIPGIRDFVRFANPGSPLLVEKGADVRYESSVFYADSTLFSVFDFDLISGNEAHALSRPYQMVLTESKARSWFGNTHPVGESLVVDGEKYEVTGVVADIPQNSHLQFDILLSFSSWVIDHPPTRTNWGWTPFPTYLLLEENVDPRSVADQLSVVLERHVPSENTDLKMALGLQPFEAIHFDPSRLGELAPVGNKSSLYFLSLVAMLILLLAVVNYINLSLASYEGRSREIGVRKTIGASSTQIGLRYLSEGWVLSVASVGLALLFTIFLLPVFGDWFDRNLQFAGRQLLPVAVIVVAFAALLGLITAAYPSFVAASLKPVAIFRGKGLGNLGQVKIRKVFTMAQFAISIGLLIGAIAVFRQLNYVLHKDLGFDRSGKLVVEFGNTESLQAPYSVIKSKLSEVPGVKGVSFSSHVPAQSAHNVSVYVQREDGQTRNAEVDLFLVDHDFLDLYGLKMIAGRPFSEDFRQDTAGALILSRSTTELLGFSDPGEIIGLEFSQWDWQGRVVGVVEDFNYQSLHNEPGPITFQYQPQYFETLTIELAGDQLNQSIRELQSKWADVLPGLPFEYYFLDDSLSGQYVSDLRLGQLISFSTVLALLLGCLGLIGLVAHSCRRQAKNMAIRKIFGASVRQILSGQLLEFGRPVLLAWGLAIGPSLWLLNRWLSGFAYRLPVPVWLIVGSGLLALILVSLIVVAQSMGTVRANPVKFLKEE